MEEIRLIKYKFGLMMEDLASKGYHYNNTLYLTPQDPLDQPNLSSDYLNNNPFNIFNDNAHRDLLIVNRYLLRPAYLALKNQMKTSINNSVATFQTIYIVLLSLFFVTMVGIYFVVWRPFENGLNQTVRLFLFSRFTKRKICFLLYLKRSWHHWIIFISFSI